MKTILIALGFLALAGIMSAGVNVCPNSTANPEDTLLQDTIAAIPIAPADTTIDYSTK